MGTSRSDDPFAVGQLLEYDTSDSDARVLSEMSVTMMRMPGRDELSPGLDTRMKVLVTWDEGRRRMMQALVFRYSLPRLAFARLFGLLTPRAYLGLGAPTRLEQVEEPTPLGDDWTVVRTAMCGICGSDVK